MVTAIPNIPIFPLMATAPPPPLLRRCHRRPNKTHHWQQHSERRGGDVSLLSRSSVVKKRFSFCKSTVATWSEQERPWGWRWWLGSGLGARDAEAVEDAVASWHVVAMTRHWRHCEVPPIVMLDSNAGSRCVAGIHFKWWTRQRRSTVAASARRDPDSDKSSSDGCFLSFFVGSKLKSLVTRLCN